MKNIEYSVDMEKQLAENLVKAGLISEEYLYSALNYKKLTGKRLDNIFVEQGRVKLETILYFQENLITEKSRIVSEKKLYESSIFSQKSKMTEVIRQSIQVDNNSLEVAINPNKFTINLSAHRVFQICLKIICFLICGHIITQSIQRNLPDFFLRDFFADLFNLDKELNIPAVYSALTLLFSSIILTFIACIKNERCDRYTRYWKSLSIIFVLLFFDELVSWHERFIGIVKAIVNTSGLLYFAWVIPGSIGVMIFLILFFKFIINLPVKTRNHFLIAGTIYIAGAIGCELFGGYFLESNQTLFYMLEVILEEFLEKLGIAVFIYGLLSHISYYPQDTVLQFAIPSQKAR